MANPELAQQDLGDIDLRDIPSNVLQTKGADETLIPLNRVVVDNEQLKAFLDTLPDDDMA